MPSRSEIRMTTTPARKTSMPTRWAVATALASQLGDGGALSTMNAASALEASPQPRPCSMRPAISGATLRASPEMANSRA